MNIKEELNKIEIEAQKITNEAIDFMNSLYPLNNVSFMNQIEREKIEKLKRDINLLYDNYYEVYSKIPFEERKNYEFNNFLANFNVSLRKIDGLDMIGPNSDEFELRDAFSKAYGFAIKSIDGLVESEKNGNQEGVNKNKRVLAACNQVFDGHFWGENYKDRISKYENRIRTGRTIDQDLTDYYKLVEDTKTLAFEYAKAIKRGITEQEAKMFEDSFKYIFSKEENLLMFVPRHMVEYTNLHWLKVAAERETDKFLMGNDMKSKK